MSKQQQSDGAAWKKSIKTKNGNVEILSITIGDKRYTAWPNSFKKEGEKSPDYRLQIDTYKPEKSTTTQSDEDLPF